MLSMEIPSLDNVIQLINDNEDLIQYSYKGKDNQLLMSQALVEKIYAVIEQDKPDSIDKKELLKIAIRQAFDLCGNDVVVSRSGQLFIKTFDAQTKKDVNEKDAGTVASRYNGFSEEELRDFYQEFFAEEDSEDFFQLIAKKYFQKYFTKNSINNEKYEKYVFAYIKQIIAEQLDSMYDDDNDSFFQGFAGYIFRIHFTEVFEYIADLMLYEIAINNTSMINFLKYYSLNIIVIGGKKYKVPSLETQDGLRWNVVSMLSIAKIYTKSKSNLDKFKKEIKKITKEMSQFYVESLSPSEYNASAFDKIADLEKKIQEQKLALEKNYDSLELSDDENANKKIKSIIIKIKSYIETLLNQKKEILNTMISKAQMHQYANLQKELEILQKEYKKEKKVIMQNQKAYMSMRSSLVKALTEKKQLL
ncbi:hypothetical protein [Sulfurimonas sp.]